ncbi:MAG: ATP-utilizing enzyme of the PP-loop superfamily [uncultured Nocardioidaceae bacterium]|uniref:ATP-utilizing enzyme of the PP-loop superfamily n=1 Tax=uncultured Nocardioidaceae bacterium TaxID=253824 RepID=A0A6J4KWA4_9ACTN|nr:MAG: ATP-utilizing enzyme of the PP-loop superfamily [uncultured Nocardioidaceae bacterium]
MDAAGTDSLVVGFDLDMTLVDTRPGVVAALEALRTDTGYPVDAAAIAGRLGPPLDLLLQEDHPELDPDVVRDLVTRFRVLYPGLAVAPTLALAGAHEALAAVRVHGGRTLVVTGKHAPNALLHTEALAFDVDEVVGGTWGVGKGAVLREHGASVFVGDHVHDVEGARAAGVLSVSVLTGSSTEAELRAAGTDVVLDSLAAFPAWLEEHVLLRRTAALEERLRGLGSVLVAFSGGADSALVLAAAVRVLGADRVAAATAYSGSLPARERDPARAFAAGLGVRVLTPETHEMEREGYRRNAGDRCFHCKAELLDVLTPLAQAHGLAAVATGTNADDLVAGFRPGIRAAAQRGACTPLADAGLTKAQVREVSRRWGLPTWDKPAAACLSSRIAYGLEVTPAGLARVERAEEAVRRALAGLGLTAADLRVRDLGDSASIELDRDLVAGLAPDAVAALTEAVRGEGFTAARVDPRGFRSGAMNERLPDPTRWR